VKWYVVKPIYLFLYIIFYLLYGKKILIIFIKKMCVSIRKEKKNKLFLIKYFCYYYDGKNI